nr:unnamed protein product [Spirometra erinaceieuropaei]
MGDNGGQKESLSTSLLWFLDGTLWPFDCDTYDGTKFHLKNGLVYDESNTTIAPYSSSESILKLLKAEPDIKLAVASRTTSPSVARQLLHMYSWSGLFDYMEIYPTSKIQHFTALRKKSNIPFSEMLFFDDLSWNISEVSRLGVHAHLVHNGVDAHVLRNALLDFAKHSTVTIQT